VVERRARQVAHEARRAAGFREPVDLSGLRSWSFITSHAQVLLALAERPDAYVDELAEATRLTPRSVYRVLADLQKGGFVRRSKRGRRNRYELNPELPLGDAPVEQVPVGYLLELLGRANDLQTELAARLAGRIGAYDDPVRLQRG
jgi:DNA-binding transcriptional ArsR family regulator